MYTAIQSGGHTAYNYKVYVIEKEKDLEEIPLDTCCMGSKAQLLGTNTFYQFDGQETWYKMPAVASGSTGGDSSAEIEQLKEQIAALQIKNTQLTQEIEELKSLTVTTDMWNALGGETDGNGTLTLAPQMFTLAEDGTLVFDGETK